MRILQGLMSIRRKIDVAWAISIFPKNNWKKKLQKKIYVVGPRAENLISPFKMFHRHPSNGFWKNFWCGIFFHLISAKRAVYHLVWLTVKSNGKCAKSFKLSLCTIAPSRRLHSKNGVAAWCGSIVASKEIDNIKVEGYEAFQLLIWDLWRIREEKNLEKNVN